MTRIHFLLPLLPLHGLLGLLFGQLGKYQVRIGGLPGQRLGLIQGQAKQLFLGAKRPLELPEERR